MPEGLASTLIHFAPLLTTTFPCGQYFFFEIWKPGNQEGGERRLIRPILRFQILRETFSHRISPPVSADRDSTAAHRTSYPRIKRKGDQDRRKPNPPFVSHSWPPGFQISSNRSGRPIESLAFFGFPFYLPAARLNRYVPRSSRHCLHPGRRPTLRPRPAG